jgi:hypothetical protein
MAVNHPPLSQQCDRCENLRVFYVWINSKFSNFRRNPVDSGKGIAFALVAVYFE